jgi:hypothetical protein
MSPLQRILIVHKYYYNRGGNNREFVNSVYLNIIKQKYNVKNVSKDMQREVIKKYNTKTGTYENKM